jgi:adenosine kinase
MESQKLIFAIGNPLLDISAECDTSVLEKYGLTNGMACLAEDKHKTLFEDLWKQDNMESIPGGAGMNALRSANFMLKGEHENSCMYFGSISADERGDVLKKALESEKIESDFSIAEDTYTGACAVVINNKERALCADLAACLKYKTEHLESNIEKLVNYKIIYLSGFFITSNLEALKKVAQYATDNDKTFAFNLGAVFLIDCHKDEYLDIIQHADIIFGNEDEIDAFGKAHGVESKDRKDVAEFIAKLPKKNVNKPRVVIAHQGSLPAITSIYDSANDKLTTATNEFDVLPADQVVDLNSAGDSFAGGYLAATALGHGHETALKAAFYSARYIIQSSGCSFPTPNEFEYPVLS